MHIEKIRDYCLAKPWVTEGFHSNDKALVIKVMRELASEVTTAGHLNKSNHQAIGGYSYFQCL